MVELPSDWRILCNAEQGEDVSCFYGGAFVGFIVQSDPPEILLPFTLWLFIVVSLLDFALAAVQIARRVVDLHEEVLRNIQVSLLSNIDRIDEQQTDGFRMQPNLALICD